MAKPEYAIREVSLAEVILFLLSIIILAAYHFDYRVATYIIFLDFFQLFKIIVALRQLMETKRHEVNIETINDLDENVVNFFQWLKNDPEKLAHELWYIPYSHSVYNNAVQNKAQNSLEQAVNYCIMLNMGHGFRTGGPVSGWKSDIHGRERAYAAKNWASLPSRLEEAAARLRGVQIECMPALELIPKYRYKDVLLYLDPPYVLSSRAGGLQYAKEMSDADHEKLLEVILDHPGPVVLSGYDSDLYRNMLKDWHRIELEGRTQSHARRTEVIWTNYIPPQAEQLTFELD